MRYKIPITWAATILLIDLITGCSTNVTRHNQTHDSKPTKDGTVTSRQEIKTYQSITGTDVKLYKIIYWSKGYKVEALLTEPAKKGPYPLLLNLHGGAVWREGGHSSFGYTAKRVAELANAHTVMLYPEYQGYMDSQGSVMGIKTDMANISNAIAIAKSLGEVKPNDMYVVGYSLGGGLALMTAAKDHDVRAVVSVSPFVGLIDFVTWARANAKMNTIFNDQMTLIQGSYGMNINSAAYKERSPNIQSIKAPVLLLQGTADKRVAWQTVQTFANQMKAAHKTVKFILYHGGHHGLHTIPYQSESTKQMNDWFKKYGLSVQQ